MCIIFL
jgi:hypothetical protein